MSQLSFNIDLGEVVSRDKTSDEWFTPKYILDWLGPIAFDPCANPSSKVDAAAYGYLAEGWNGLTLSWDKRELNNFPGVVFVNPPYSDCSSWVDKCAEESRDSTRCIIALVPAYAGDAYWHRSVWGQADWVAYHRGRVRFDTEHGPAKDAASFTSALVCWNDPLGFRLKLIAERAKSRLFFQDAKTNYRNPLNA